MLGQDDKRGRAVTKTSEQITIKVDHDLRAALVRVAAEEHRTVSGQIRRILALALRPGKASARDHRSAA